MKRIILILFTLLPVSMMGQNEKTSRLEVLQRTPTIKRGNELQIQTSDDRIVEMRVRQDNLLILDVEEQQKHIGVTP